MQEIGLSLFYKTKFNKCITKEKTIETLFDVSETIAKQFIWPYFEESDKRKEYKSLLVKIGLYQEFKVLKKIVFEYWTNCMVEMIIFFLFCENLLYPLTCL